MSAPGQTSLQPEPAVIGWSSGGLGEAAEAAGLAVQAFDPQFREAWTEAQMAGLLGTPSAWLELGHAGPELVSFALCRQAADEVELLLCATHPRWRRAGVGLALVGRVVDEARRRGAQRLFLEVRATNKAALALYRRAGFRAAGNRPAYYRTTSGETIDAITLELRL
jgi:ribosomal-protein-alanine N-acetyltransferase